MHSVKSILHILLFIHFVYSCADDTAPDINDKNDHPVETGILTGIHVKDGKLVDKDGKAFIPYGVNSIHVWLDGSSSTQALENEISKSGANTVRLVTAGKSWTWNQQSRTSAQKRSLIEKAIKAGLVPMIEVHDGTCLHACDQPAAEGKMGLKQIVDEWLEPENLAMLKDFEGQLMLNIANEWGPTDDVFLNCYKDAITRLRNAGVKNVLVIDAGGCGQNPQTLLQYGNQLFQHDPLKNVVLAIHMYGRWRTDDRTFDNQKPPFSVEEIIPKLAALEAPVIVGEFGWTGEGSAGNYNPKILMETCKENGIGWLFWAWSDGLQKPFYSLVATPDYLYSSEQDLTEAGKFIIHDPDLGFKSLSKSVDF